MMHSPTLRQRLRYAFDRTMSRGTIALIGWLGILSLLLVVVFSAVVLLGHFSPPGNNDHRPGVARQLLSSFLHSIDPGTIGNEALGNNTIGWPFLAVMLLITLGGLFIVSALIGVIATGFEERLRELRKGRSLVIEQGHTLILGWSPHVFTILSELAIAKESERKPAIVIVADQDKIEMEDAIRQKVGSLGKLRVAVRTGDPADPDDIALGNPRAARSIIVLADETATDPDSQVIKSVLALVHGPARREVPYHIVAIIDDAENLEAAELAGRGEAIFVSRRETIARLLVHTSRQSGASIVFTDLLDFAGDEIYFRHDPSFVGRTYAEALLAYEEATTIGLASDARTILNPPPDTVVAAGDSLIAIAEDDSVLEIASPCSASIEEAAIELGERPPAGPQRMLLLGWNAGSAAIVNELDDYLESGSEITAVSAGTGVERQVAEDCPGLRNVSVTVRQGETARRRTLEALDVASYDQIIVASDTTAAGTGTADANTLVTLLHLRELEARTGKRLSITSELADDRNRRLAQVTNVDDVIVSDQLISLLVAQLSEDARLRHVFAELFRAEGSEIYLRPAGQYVRAGVETSFATVVAAARRRGETAIGVRVGAQSHDAAAGYGVRLSPPKSTRFALGEGDQVIVLAVD